MSSQKKKEQQKNKYNDLCKLYREAYPYKTGSEADKEAREKYKEFKAGTLDLDVTFQELRETVEKRKIETKLKFQKQSISKLFTKPARTAPAPSPSHTPGPSGLQKDTAPDPLPSPPLLDLLKSTNEGQSTSIDIETKQKPTPAQDKLNKEINDLRKEILDCQKIPTPSPQQIKQMLKKAKEDLPKKESQLKKLVSAGKRNKKA